MLFVEPICGLANRMRVIAAARCLLNEVGLFEPNDLQCIWQKYDDLAADYTDLFEEPKDFQLCKPFKYQLRSTYKDKWYQKLKSHIMDKFHEGVDLSFSYKDIDRIIGIGTPYQNNQLFFDKIKKPLSKRKNIYFSGYHYLKDLFDVTIFTPQNSLMTVINEFCENFNEHTYGLHIRRTDNIEAIEYSPISLFEDKVEQLLINDSDCRFYLSTDDPAVQKEFLSKYGSHILFRDKQYGRDNLAGMQDAVIDMWILSRTNTIFGSYYSSFSRMASLVGCHKLEILKK